MARILLILCVVSPAAALERPALDGFYARTRARAAAFDDCLGFCDGRWLLQALIGGQMANPSTEALAPALAEGARLGIDGGWRPNRQSVLRSKVFADLLVVNETGDSITDLVWQNTLFYSTTEHRSADGGVHLSLDTVLADRTELEPEDFAEFRLRPYRMVDAEAEVTALAPRIDKDANLAFPIGAAWRSRWDRDDRSLEERLTLSGAIAARGFPKGRGDHYQLDFARLTHVRWATPAGDASAWRVSAGYQRLSPDLPGLELWILGGYGWQEGANAPNGWLTQLGAVAHVDQAHHAGLGHEAWFALDQANRRFARLHRTNLYYRYDDRTWRAGLGWDRVSREGDVLHALVPELGWRPDWMFGLMLGARFRLAFHDGDDVAPAQERFQINLDWLL